MQKNDNNLNRHTISILVENRAGVLARIAGLFARRGYNIDSLAVGVTDDESVSRITIVAQGSGYTLEQIEKQLNKLIDVIKVKTLSSGRLTSRELLLIKVHANAQQRAEIMTIAEIFAAKISDMSTESITLELSANAERLANFEEILRPYGIKEIVRTGTIALEKGPSALKL
ncbi:MAG: acetolactate synthase small subunit [Clostridiales bacterium]|nr:acetolactate synthase small subunit [Clostridiales bacterium]